MCNHWAAAASQDCEGLRNMELSPRKCQLGRNPRKIRVNVAVTISLRSQFPLRRSRLRLGRRQRLRVAGGEQIEQLLIDVNIEHHVHAVAVAALGNNDAANV